MDMNSEGHETLIPIPTSLPSPPLVHSLSFPSPHRPTLPRDRSYKTFVSGRLIETRGTGLGKRVLVPDRSSQQSIVKVGRRPPNVCFSSNVTVTLLTITWKELEDRETSIYTRRPVTSVPLSQDVVSTSIFVLY